MTPFFTQIVMTRDYFFLEKASSFLEVFYTQFFFVYGSFFFIVIMHCLHFFLKGKVREEDNFFVTRWTFLSLFWNTKNEKRSSDQAQDFIPMLDGSIIDFVIWFIIIVLGHFSTQNWRCASCVCKVQSRLKLKLSWFFIPFLVQKVSFFVSFQEEEYSLH